VGGRLHPRLLAHQLRYLVGDACQPPAPIEQFSATSDAPTWSQGDFIHDLYTAGFFRETAPNWLDFAALA